MNLLFGNYDSKHKLSNFQHKINYIKNCIHKYHIHTLFLIINLLILVYYIITTIYAHQLFVIYFTSVFIILFSTDGYYRIGFKIYDKLAELKPDQFFKSIYIEGIKYADSNLYYITDSRLKGGLSVMKLDDPQFNIIGCEWNENYYNYHYAKSAMSDIINSTFYILQNGLKINMYDTIHKLEIRNQNNVWKLYMDDSYVNISDEMFSKLTIKNIHANYVDMDDVIKIDKKCGGIIESLDYCICEAHSNLNSGEKKSYVINKYGINIYELENSYSSFINSVLKLHYTLANKSGANDITDVIKCMKSSAKEYKDMFSEDGKTLYLNRNNNYALPNPDGLLFN